MSTSMYVMAWIPIALAAISAASAVAGTVMAATRSGAATSRGQGEADLSMLEKEYAQRSRTRANQVQADTIRTTAAETDVTSAGVRLQTAQQEMGRRRTLQQLTAANTTSRIGRGAIYDPYDSASAIEGENQRLGEEDISTLRLMGESSVRKLSFQKRQLELQAKGVEAGLGEQPIRRDPYLDLAADQRSQIWGEAGLKIGKELAGFGMSAYRYLDTPSFKDTSFGGAGAVGQPVPSLGVTSAYG
jgi:hypothetical protein